MSEGINKVMLFGNVGSDPELRYTQSSKAVLKFRLATNESWFDKETNERKEHAEWHSVVMWGKRAEALSKHIGKGSSLIIEGKLRTTSWDKDGQKHWKTEVEADNIIFAGKRDGGSERREQSAPAQQGGPTFA